MKNKKIEKLYLIISVIFIFFLCFKINIKNTYASELAAPTGFTHLYEENDTYMYTYLSSCTIVPASNQLTSTNWQQVSHIQKPQAIILPKNIPTITNTYVFFHGLLFTGPSIYPKENVASPTENDLYKLYTTGGNTKYFLSKQMEDLEKQNIGGVIFFPRLYQIAGGSYNIAAGMTKNQFDCFYNEAQSKLRSIPGINYQPSSLTVFGHSAGGNTVKYFSKLGYSTNNILLFDACYGDWCASTVQSNIAGKYFIYYNQNNADTVPGAQVIKNMNSGKVKLVSTTGLTHEQVLSSCFIDHINNTMCGGKGKLESQPTSSTQVPTTNTQQPKTTVSADTIFSEVQIEIKKPTPKINIPGLNFSDVDITKMTTTDGTGNTWLNIPFLGEYISAIYKYSMVLISVLAVFGIIISGVMLIGSGGNSDIVSKAKKRMMVSVIGIIIAVTSYSLLYLINPELVKFRNLKILMVKGEPLTPVEETSHLDENGQLPPADTTVVKKFSNISEPNADDFKQDNINKEPVDGFVIWSSLEEDQKNTVLPYLYDYLNECQTAQNIVTTGIETGNFKNKKLSSEVIPALKKAISTAEQYGFELYVTGIDATYRDNKTQAQLWNTGIVARFLTNKEDWSKNEGLIANPGCEAPHATGGAIDIGMKQNGNAVIIPGDTDLKTKNTSSYKKIFLEQSPPYRLILEEIMRQSGWVRFCEEYWHFENSVTIRYQKWDKADDTRCVYAYTNWKIPIPDDVKIKANNTVNGTIFK